MTVTPNFGNSPLTVSLNGSCSSDPDGTITQYRWDMGDGAVRFGQTASHVYFQEGNFQVRLTVTDNDGQTDDALDFVFVTCDDFILCPQ